MKLLLNLLISVSISTRWLKLLMHKIKTHLSVGNTSFGHVCRLIALTFFDAEIFVHTHSYKYR